MPPFMTHASYLNVGPRFLPSGGVLPKPGPRMTFTAVSMCKRNIAPTRVLSLCFSCDYRRIQHNKQSRRLGHFARRVESVRV